MTKIFDWLKRNKLTAFLILIVLYLLLRPSILRQTALRKSYDMGSSSQEEALPAVGNGFLSESVPYEPAPAPNVKNRLVISESYLSLLVNNVVDVQKKIIKKAQELDGYMVNSNLSNPQDSPSATVIVRIPSKKLDQALDYFRPLAIKVISENLAGEDVTDQYVDNQAKLETLLKTKAKFEEILNKAEKVAEILEVQRELINLQSQIDSVKGQQTYLEKSAQMAKMTVYLATDEIALPYAPSEAWRPKVIFKQASRSLISSLRKLGTLIIWLIVFSVIWLPALLIYKFFIKRKSR